MPVMAISAIFSPGQGPSQQQGALRDDMQGLQKALSAGNLASIQRALNLVSQDVQGIRPPLNGVRPQPEVNPAATMRADLDALQSALNSGDLPAAQRAFVRMQQDSQQISTASQQPGKGTSANAPSALPSPNKENAPNGTGPSETDGSQGSTGSLIDVSG